MRIIAIYLLLLLGLGCPLARVLTWGATAARTFRTGDGREALVVLVLDGVRVDEDFVVVRDDDVFFGVGIMLLC